MSMKKFYYSLISLGILSTARAQVDSSAFKQLDEVTVTGSKTSLKQSETGKIVTVLDAKAIRNNEGKTLTELLNTQAGFMLVGANNAPGTNIDPYFRGASDGNLLIVVDGVPVYDPSQISNTFDLNTIPLEQIERIEILKGGASTIWGSDAVAGVIQIFLKKENKKPLAANATYSYGSYNTMHAGAGIDGTIKKLGYRLQYDYQKSAGFSAAYDSTGKSGFDKDGFSQNNLLAELNYAFSKAFNVKATGNFSDYHNDLDEGAFTDDKDYTASNKNNAAAVYLNYHQQSLKWTTLFSYQQARRYFTDDSTDISSPYTTYQRGRYLGNTYTAESYANIVFSTHMQLVGGVQYIRQSTDQYYLSEGSFGPFESSIGKDSAKASQVSGYASYLLTGMHGFNFEAGIRVNHHSIYGTNATYTFNPSFTINEHTKIFVNISSAYKIPSLYQLYSEYGNKALKPESSTTYEIGLQAESADAAMFFRIAAFKRDIRDLITFFTDPNTFASHYINSDRQHDYGFEAESDFKLGKAGDWSNNFSFVDGDGIIDGVKTKNLYRRPDFILNSRLNLQPAKHLVVGPAFRYVGDRMKGPYDIGPDTMPHYYTVDCFVSYQFPHLRLFANFQNITNQQYFDIYGYNSKRFNMMAGLNLLF
jgi:vitamin B12 transporter